MNPTPSANPSTRRWLQLALLLAILALGMAVRLWALDALPPGLYRDEAVNGLDALDVLSGARPLYFEANNGREPAFIYLQALAVDLLGRTPFALRLPAALLGGLTILATYVLGRALSPDRRLALIAAFLAASSAWMMMLSRTGLRAVALPPLSALTLAALWRGLARRQWGWMALAGLALGACQYTYLAARFCLMAVALGALWLLIRQRRAFWWGGWILLVGAALLVALPLGIYFAQHWGAVSERAAQVSIFSPMVNGGHPWRVLAENVWRTILGLFYRGDFIPRHNIPLRPVFSPLLALACVGGLALAFARARREPAWGMALIWLGAMLLPTILAEGAPHFLRASGILPVALLLPALGITWLWGDREPSGGSAQSAAPTSGRLAASALTRADVPSPASRERVGPSAGRGEGSLSLPNLGEGRGEGVNPLPGLGEGRRLRRGEGWMLSLFLLLILCGDAYYSVRAFVAHLRSEAVYYQFEAGATELARQANALLGRGWVGGWGELHSSPQAAVLMARRFWRGWPSLPYLVQEGAGLTVLTKSGKLPEGAAAPTSPAVALLWPFEDNARALAALPVGRIAVTEGAYERGDLDAESRPLYIVVRVDPAPAPAGEPSGVWADGTALTGYALTPREGQRLQVQLVWQASGAPVTAATVFRHALCDGRLVGQLDGPPAGGHYPREAWRAGDWVEDEATISLDRAWSPGICLVEIGWYDGASGTRLALRQTALPHEESALTLR